jgi:hypothetical protein
MIMIVSSVAIFGVALGLRYKVLVLIPLMFCIGLSIAISEIAISGALQNSFLSSALIFTSLQIGYIGGAASRYLNLGAQRGWRSTPPFELPAE